MVPKPNASYFAPAADAELEWLLCLAAAMQAREKQPKKFKTESQPPPKPRFWSRLQDLLKGLRGSERLRAAQ